MHRAGAGRQQAELGPRLDARRYEASPWGKLSLSFPLSSRKPVALADFHHSFRSQQAKL